MENEELERDDVQAEEEEVTDLAKLIQGMKDKENEESEEEEKTEEKASTETKETKETKTEEKATETSTEVTAKTYSEDEFNTALEQKLQERLDAAVREASQKAADAVLKRERSKQDNAVQKLKEYEAKAGMSLDKLIEAQRTQRVQSLVDAGYDETTAKDMAAKEAKLREYEMTEAQRQNEIRTMQAKDMYRELRDSFYNDAKSDPSVVKLAKKYQADIDTFAHDAIENNNPVPYDVARDFILGKHLPELLKEQQAELERVKTAQEQKTLANVQKRAKATVENGGLNMESAPSLSRAETTFLKKLGMNDKDIADIAKKRAAKKK